MEPDKKEHVEQANDKILDFYARLIASSEDEHVIVGYSEASHLKRFNKMLELGDFHGKSILDIGCGPGGFYRFLKSKGIEADYYGVDITPGMIEEAKKRNPDIADRFEVFDILKADYKRQFDYCISIGPLNLNFGTNINEDMNYTLMQQMFKHSAIGFAGSLTSNQSPKQTADTYYYDPAAITNKVLTITRNFRLDHSYLPNDFTIFCYKEELYKPNK
jgi:SAM-dependent methyltransferase